MAMSVLTAIEHGRNRHYNCGAVAVCFVDTMWAFGKGWECEACIPVTAIHLTVHLRCWLLDCIDLPVWIWAAMPEQWEHLAAQEPVSAMLMHLHQAHKSAWCNRGQQHALHTTPNADLLT
jgi:hypothetical protein